MSLLTSWLRLGSPWSKKEPCPCVSHDSLAIVEKADVLREQRLDARTEKAQALARSIVHTHSELLKLPHLRPAPAINQLLGNLVSVCSEIHDREFVDKVLSNPDVQAVLPSLRQICARAESCLELHWAEHILSSEGSPDEVLTRLKAFPYYENYQELTRLEYCAILSATRIAPQRVAFIGSGPLPLTSLCLLQLLKQQNTTAALIPNPPSSTTNPTNPPSQKSPVILNVDYDASAIAASLTLSLALGETGRGMEFICADAAAPSERDLAEFDVVYMAALVGVTQTEKESIMLRVVDRMRAGALLVVRSSWGLRTCLYPEVDLATEALLEKLECCVVVHPYGQVVNSVIVARVKA